MSRITVQSVKSQHIRGSYAGRGGLPISDVSISDTTANPVAETNPNPQSAKIVIPQTEQLTKREFVTTVAFEEDTKIAGFKRKDIRNREHLAYDPLSKASQGYVGKNSGEGTSGNSNKYGNPQDVEPLNVSNLQPSNWHPTGHEPGTGGDVNLRNMQGSTHVRGKITL